MKTLAIGLLLMGLATAPVQGATLAPDAVIAAKKIGFPIVRGTVVYCVEPQSGIVDQMWLVNSSQSVSCPGNDIFFITQKSEKFIKVEE